MKIASLLSPIRLLFRNCYLLVTCPMEFLYTLTYPKGKVVRIFSYNPQAGKQGRQLVTLLQRKMPGLTVHFVGSAALGIAGMKDIDILIECLPVDFPLYIPLLTGMFGSPKKAKSVFIEWGRPWKGYRLEVMMLDPRSRMYRLEMEAFERLKNNGHYKHEYEEIKLKSNGVSVREYQRRKLAFYHNVLQIRHLPRMTELPRFILRLTIDIKTKLAHLLTIEKNYI